MSTPTFDTLKFVERLERAGIPREQAVALLQAQEEVFSKAMDSTLVTKSDIENLKSEVVKVDRCMDRLDAKLDKLVWMLGIVVVLAVADFAKHFI